jgi:hypothetical protein
VGALQPGQAALPGGGLSVYDTGICYKLGGRRKTPEHNQRICSHSTLSTRQPRTCSSASGWRSST